MTAMQLPETPAALVELDLIKRLNSYATGEDSWLPNSEKLSKTTSGACQELLANLIKIDKLVSPILDKVNSREMDVFTMHDKRHALKVAHIMWHILKPERRLSLTAPEIGMLIASAFVHDLGMFISKEDRDKRLSPTSELWGRLDPDGKIQQRIEELRTSANQEKALTNQQRLHRKVIQAEEALLCQDTREVHATSQRYADVLSNLRQLHTKNPAVIPDVESCLAFEGDSFREKLIDVCVSHNEAADMLIRQDTEHPERPRFPRDYPVGSCLVDLHMVAAALRLADILDFDRERTPTVLYYYLLPSHHDPSEDKSELEWSKHLAISSWHVETDSLVYRARCRNHIVHHSIIRFCESIAEEISATRASFGALNDKQDWPFVIPKNVKDDIHAEGYRYLPYKFELDDERIYQLLMGGAIYGNSLEAIRELVQNSVDACKLRDALTKLHEPEVNLSTAKRITVEYIEPTEERPSPTLVVRDSGTGMDDMVINSWFLKVGRSYYSSTDFNRFRYDLRKAGLDFAPISEFGIGFLSCFLLADQVCVETAMWESIHGDTRKRLLEINGPTRLIRLHESENTGAGRFRGTTVTLSMIRGHPSDSQKPPTWEVVRDYLKYVCILLPYTIHLLHKTKSETLEEIISPKTCLTNVPPRYSEHAVFINVDDAKSGLSGEIAIVNGSKAIEIEKELGRTSIVRVEAESAYPARRRWDDRFSSLVRGGFKIGGIPGLPFSSDCDFLVSSTLNLTWEHNKNRRYALTNLSRNEMPGEEQLAQDVQRIWMSWLLQKVDSLQPGFMDGLDTYFPVDSPQEIAAQNLSWIEQFDAYTVYKLAANGWHSWLHREKQIDSKTIVSWQNSTGQALPIPEYDRFGEFLFVDLLYLILPRICNLHLKNGNFFVSPPKTQWQNILQNCRDYTTKPALWTPFVGYEEPDASLLYLDRQDSGYWLNSKHRERVLSGIKESDLSTFVDALDDLVIIKQERLVSLSAAKAKLLKQAQEKFGDLEVGTGAARWRIDSFRLTE